MNNKICDASNDKIILYVVVIMSVDILINLFKFSNWVLNHIRII